MEKFWKFTNAVESSESELVLDGAISSESWWGDEITPAAFREELKQQKGNKLTVILNSGGGDVFAGLSIYNALREHDAEVTIRVDGVAASIASIIAMAGNQIIMSPGSMMMIHRPSVLAVGNVNDLEKAKQVLVEIEDSIIPIYADRTGLSTETIAEMLDEETWMSAERTVELGFADSVANYVKKTEAGESVQNVAHSFSFSMAATKESLESFYKKVNASTEERIDEITKEEVEETPAAPEVPAEPVPDEVVVTEPETVEEVETVETNKPNESQMKDTDTQVIAQSQVIEPSNQATPDTKPTATDYLKSQNALVDFANVLQANAGSTAEEVKAAWANHLETKMGITNPEVLLPGGVISAIEDAFSKGGEIWNLVNKTGLTVFRNAIDTATGEVSRAKGHTRGDEKGEEEITLADRVVRAQFIYKYLTLNKEDLRENRDTGALLRYVLTELPKRIVREVERAIVIGDGRANDSDYKITEFVSIKADATADNAYASTYTPAADESRYETILRAKALVKADGAKYLVAKAGYMTSLLLEQGVNGGYIFAPGTNLAQAMGFAGVIEPDWMDDDADNDAYIFTPDAYTTVGDNTIEAYTNFVLKENKQEYLQEIYAGGALTSMNSGVAIATQAVS